MKKLVLAAAMVVFSSGAAHAATTSGTATATVVAPLNVTHANGAALRFGTFTAGTGGTVVVTIADVGTTTGGVIHLAGSSSTADTFNVTGDGNRGYTISLGTGNSVTSGSNSMAYTLTSNATGTLAAGSGSFKVGGTLTVGNNQAAGNYTDSYDVTVNYQ